MGGEGLAVPSHSESVSSLVSRTGSETGSETAMPCIHHGLHRVCCLLRSQFNVLEERMYSNLFWGAPAMENNEHC